MSYSPTTPRRSPIARNILLTTVAAGTLVGAGAYWQLNQYVSKKPGEDTLARFAPENTLFAATLDLKPNSFEQGQAMQRIQTALQKQGLDERLRDSLRKMTKDAPLIVELSTNLSGSGAAFAWQKDGMPLQSIANAVRDGKSTDFLLIFDLKKPSDTTALLQKRAVRELSRDGAKISVLHLDKDHTSSDNDAYATVADNYLMVASSEDAIAKSLSVRSGKTVSLAKSADYAAIRKTVPAEANLLIYASRELMQAQKDSYTSDPAQKALMEQISSNCTAVTVRQDGLALDSSTSAKADFLAPVRDTAPIDTASLRLPENPVGVITYSQPGKLVEVADKVTEAIGGETRRSWDKGVADFERETKLTVKDDIIPALNGQWTAAAYVKNNRFDFLVLADAAHGAKPAELFQKLKTLMEKKDSQVRIETTEENGVTYSLLPLPYSGKLPSPSGEPLASSDTDNKREPQKVLAERNNVLFFATSPHLLTEAVNAYQGKSHLDTMGLRSNSFSAAFLYPARLIDVARPYADHYNKEAEAGKQIDMNDMSTLFGTAPLVASYGTNGDYFTSATFLPLNYETAAKLVAQAVSRQ